MQILACFNYLGAHYEKMKIRCLDQNNTEVKSYNNLNVKSSLKLNGLRKLCGSF